MDQIKAAWAVTIADIITPLIAVSAAKEALTCDVIAVICGQKMSSTKAVISEKNSFWFNLNLDERKE